MQNSNVYRTTRHSPYMQTICGFFCITNPRNPFGRNCFLFLSKGSPFHTNTSCALFLLLRMCPVNSLFLLLFVDPRHLWTEPVPLPAHTGTVVFRLMAFICSGMPLVPFKTAIDNEVRSTPHGEYGRRKGVGVPTVFRTNHFCSAWPSRTRSSREQTS